MKNSIQKLNSIQWFILLVNSLLIILPCILFLILFFYTPEYYYKLIEPTTLQPLGIMGVLFIVLLFLGLLFLSWIITRNYNSRMMLRIVLITLFLLVDTIFIFSIILLPAIIITLSSPIGRILFY
jgi:hypothetical protein